MIFLISLQTMNKSHRIEVIFKDKHSVTHSDRQETWRSTFSSRWGCVGLALQRDLWRTLNSVSRVEMTRIVISWKWTNVISEKNSDVTMFIYIHQQFFRSRKRFSRLARWNAIQEQWRGFKREREWDDRLCPPSRGLCGDGQCIDYRLIFDKWRSPATWEWEWVIRISSVNLTRRLVNVSKRRDTKKCEERSVSGWGEEVFACDGTGTARYATALVGHCGLSKIWSSRRSVITPFIFCRFNRQQEDWEKRQPRLVVQRRNS